MPKQYPGSVKKTFASHMAHVNKGGVYSKPAFTFYLRHLNKGGVYSRAAFNQRNTVYFYDIYIYIYI